MSRAKPSRLTRELAEMADAQRRLGIMDAATHQAITRRGQQPKADDGKSGKSTAELFKGLKI